MPMQVLMRAYESDGGVVNTLRPMLRSDSRMGHQAGHDSLWRLGFLFIITLDCRLLRICIVVLMGLNNHFCLW